MFGVSVVRRCERDRSNGHFVASMGYARSPWLSTNPDHASRRAPPGASVFLAVDQQLGERAGVRVAPELADPLDALEVGQHQDVEKLGASCRRPKAWSRDQ
jgi:hypothetical protein